MARDLLVRLRPHAEELGCGPELEGLNDLLDHGSGAHRQLAMAANCRDLPSLVAEIAEVSKP
jgi:gamma-glutamyl:cysteine ligase YbdK (ATP-grasp superfamily)